MHTVRMATLEDVTTIREIGIASWWATYTPIVPAKFIAGALRDWWSIAEITDIIAHNRRYTTVVEDENEVVGIFMGRTTADSQGGTCIWRWYLRPDAIGQGAGYSLWQDFKQALSPRVKYVELDYFKANHHARAFYERLGFKETRSATETQFGCDAELQYMRLTL